MEEIVVAGVGLVVGAALMRYFGTARAQLIEAGKVADDSPVALVEMRLEPLVPQKRRVRTFVCHDGQRLVARDREELFHAPPPNVAYTIDGEEDV